MRGGVAMHLWVVCITRDAFLRFKKSCWLKTNNFFMKHSILVVVPSNSPENSPAVHYQLSIAAGATMDNQFFACCQIEFHKPSQMVFVRSGNPDWTKLFLCFRMT